MHVNDWRTVIKMIGTFSQYQDSTVNRLRDLIWFANRLGFHDTADSIKELIKTIIDKMTVYRM